MKNIIDKSFIEMDGHVLIKDADTGDVLLDKHNAINFENMSVALANAITNKTDSNDNYYHFDGIAYGNGGSTASATGQISYETPNVNEITSTLYNETYFKQFDVDPAVVDPDNKTIVTHTPGEHYTDIIITSTLDYNEPADQNTLDNGTDLEANYVFDELGIKLKTGRFVSHILFHPIEKSANRRIQVIYTIRIRAGN
jgi:hypothetical protein